MLAVEHERPACSLNSSTSTLHASSTEWSSNILQLALATAYAAGTVSILRIRSWKMRHRVSMRVLGRDELEGIVDLIYDGCYDSEPAPKTTKPAGAEPRDTNIKTEAQHGTKMGLAMAFRSSGLWLGLWKYSGDGGNGNNGDDDNSDGVFKALSDKALEIDSLLSPFSQDWVFGVEADKQVVGLDAVRLDGSCGYVEDVRLARAVRGRGLNDALRRHSLKSIAQHSNGRVTRVRQLAFEWNEQSRSTAQNAGMELVARWGYFIVDTSQSKRGATNIQMLLNAAVDACRKLGCSSNLVCVQPERTVSGMMKRLEEACDGQPLLQYWDVYDVSPRTLLRLCSDISASDARVEETAILNKASQASSVRTRALVSNVWDTVDGAGAERGATEEDDLLLVGKWQRRSCAMRVAGVSCSLGELVDRDEPLGSLCTCTLYCPSDAWTSAPRTSLMQALAHVRYWAQLAKQMNSRSIAVFCPEYMRQDLYAALNMSISDRSLLVLYEFKLS